MESTLQERTSAWLVHNLVEMQAYSLPREALTQNFGIFVDEEIPDGIIVAVSY